MPHNTSIQKCSRCGTPELRLDMYFVVQPMRELAPEDPAGFYICAECFTQYLQAPTTEGESR